MARPTVPASPRRGRKHGRHGRSRRLSTTVQDTRALVLLKKGLPRKEVARRLRLTYWQVTLAVYRVEAPCPARL